MSGTAFIGGVLCGGRARRMGTSKEALELDGQSFMKLAVDRHRPDYVLLSGTGHYRGTSTVRDHRTGVGPLAGIESLLGIAGGNRVTDTPADWLLVSPADAPLLTSVEIGRLREAAADDRDDLVVLRGGGRVHPLSAAMRVEACLPAVTRLLDDGVRRADRLMECVRTRLIDIDARRLHNVNTPRDLAEARRLYAELAAESGDLQRRPAG